MNPAETTSRHRFIGKQGMNGALYFMDPTVNRYHQSFNRPLGKWTCPLTLHSSGARKEKTAARWHSFQDGFVNVSFSATKQAQHRDHYASRTLFHTAYLKGVSNYSNYIPIFAMSSTSFLGCHHVPFRGRRWKPCRFRSWNGGFTLALSGPDLTPSPKASQRFHKMMSFWNSVNLKRAVTAWRCVAPWNSEACSTRCVA